MINKLPEPVEGWYLSLSKATAKFAKASAKFAKRFFVSIKMGVLSIKTSMNSPFYVSFSPPEPTYSWLVPEPVAGWCDFLVA